MPERICPRCGAPVLRKTAKYCSGACYDAERQAGNVLVTCPCGNQVGVGAQEALKRRYCSDACKYRYRKRPSGLKYATKVANRAWRKPGDPPNATSFQSGHVPWNDGGGPGFRRMDRPGYITLHSRVRKQRGRAANQPCSLADATCKGPMQWANISGDYLGVDDFTPLCQSHHIRYDGGLIQCVPWSREGEAS